MRSRTVRCPRPVSLPLTLAPLQLGHHDPTTRIGPREAWRATRTPDGAATVRLEQRDATVVATAWGPGAAWALDTAPDLLGLNDDAAAFRTRHPLVRELHRRHPGLRLCRSQAVVELLIPTVLSQKVTGIEAKRAYHRMVRAAGEVAPGPPGLLLPPDPAQLAALPYYRYHPFGVERKRADTIARACARAGRLEEIVDMARADAHRRLTAFPGIGDWTAAIVARVALGDEDAVETGDFHLPNLVAFNLVGVPRADDDLMLELLEPFRGHRGRVVRLLEAGGTWAPTYGPRMALRDLSRL